MQNAARSKITEPSARRKRPGRRLSLALSRNRLGLATVAAAAILLSTSLAVRAQSGACEFVPDDANPPEKILRCGEALVVREAPGAKFHLIDRRELQLDAGAVMVECHPSKGGNSAFQIRTPYAIAAVRGTKWVVDVGSAKASTFVIEGTVAVSRPRGAQTVLLHPGDGADVSPDSGPIVVKRWPAPRVKALLARFGQ